MKRFEFLQSFLVMSLVLSPLAACSTGTTGGEPSPEEEACEHMTDGPAVEVTANLGSDTGPDVSPMHTRHDITLVEEEGAFVGTVSYAAAEAGEYALYTDVDVEINVTDASSNAIVISEPMSVDACDTVASMRTLDLEVGTYLLRFGPTDREAVRLVIEHGEEHGADHADHEEHAGE